MSEELVKKAKDLGFKESKDGVLWLDKGKLDVYLDVRHKDPRIYSFDRSVEGNPNSQKHERLKEVKELRAHMSKTRSLSDFTK